MFQCTKGSSWHTFVLRCTNIYLQYIKHKVNTSSLVSASCESRFIFVHLSFDICPVSSHSFLRAFFVRQPPYCLFSVFGPFKTVGVLQVSSWNYPSFWISSLVILTSCRSLSASVIRSSLVLLFSKYPKIRLSFPPISHVVWPWKVIFVLIMVYVINFFLLLNK